MKTSVLSVILILLSGGFISAQSIPPDSLYFGQTPPGNTPQIFAPGIVSIQGRKEPAITFSPDGASVFFYIATSNPYTMYATYSNNHWTIPDTIPFSYGRATGEPFFAYEGNRVYMFATNAVNHVGIADLSYSEKQGNNWSNPISLGNPPNSEPYQYHPCIVGDSSIYFSSNIGYICKCQYENGTYQSRVILPNPINYVGTQTWGDPYVSSDESYIIFKSIRPGGYGLHDLYIAYKKTDGSWTNPKNLGNVINTPGDETSGDITPDGLYMTYGRNNDIYWVSSLFVDSLKYTNYIPYVKNPIPDQTAVRLQLFTYTVPDTTFIDDDGNNTLSYSAKLSNGNPLPTWLVFDSLTTTFSGTADMIQTLSIRVTATDTAGATASSTFSLSVQAPAEIGENNRKDDGLRIYPNPSNGLVKISLDVLKDQPAVAVIYNLEGKIIQTSRFKGSTSIDVAALPKGIYVVRLVVDNKVLTRKLCLE